MGAFLRVRGAQHHFEFVERQLISTRLCSAHEVNNEKYEEKGPKSATHIHVILRLPITLY
jgi:hypothetical protein